MNIFYIELGKRIASCRKEQKLSQNELAKKLNITQQLIGFYELGKRRIPIDVLIKMTKTLHTDINILIGLDKPKIKKRTTSPIEKKIEEIKCLPANKQKMAIEMLDTIIKSNH